MPEWIDPKAVLNGVIASAIGLVVVLVFYNLMGSRLFGQAPRLKFGIDAGGGDLVHWVHLTVVNVGLPLANIRLWQIPLSRSTRAAQDVVATAVVNGVFTRLHWSTSRGPMESVSVPRSLTRQIPVAVRDRRGERHDPKKMTYKWLMRPDRYYLPDDVFLTQGPGNQYAQWLLSPGANTMYVVLTPANGGATVGRFTIEVPEELTGTARATLRESPWRWWERRKLPVPPSRG